MANASTVTLGRLRSGREIAAVFGSRDQVAGQRVVLFARSTRPNDAPRLAVVASRRVGRAVARNRAKRLVREAARQVNWKRGTDLVVVARSECARSTLHEVCAELAALGQALDVIEGP